MPIDDHSRCGFVQMHNDERKESAVQALKAAAAHYRALGITVKRLLTDSTTSGAHADAHARIAIASRSTA